MARHTVVEIVNDDMPFLVSSISAEIQRRGLDLHLVLHPVLGVRRDDDGRRLEVTAPDAPRRPARVADAPGDRPGDLRGAPAGARRRADRGASATCGGWSTTGQPMRQHVPRRRSRSSASGRRRCREDELEEGLAFLGWLAEDHFTFLGYREYDLVEEGGETYLRVRPETGLGLLRRVRPDSERRSRTPLRRTDRRVPAPPRAADRHQDLRPLAGAPAGGDGLHRRAPLRRRRPGGRRAPLPRPVLLRRLPQERAAPSRCCARRSAASSSASASIRAATTPAPCATCWRPSRATSCSRSPTTSSTRSASASCACRSASG